MLAAAAFSLVAALLLGVLESDPAAAIDASDVPTFSISCRVTNSLDGPALPPPALRSFPEPPCALNNTACPSGYGGYLACRGAQCVATNYSFSVGCQWYTPCTGTTGIETKSVGSAWSAWSSEFNMTMINTTLDARQGFYKTYPVLGVELGVRSQRKDRGVLNVSCAVRFTGRDGGQHESGGVAMIHGALQNTDDRGSPTAYTGLIGLMLGRENASQPRPGPQVRTYRQYNWDRFFSELADIPAPPKLAKLFPISDAFAGDNDLGSTADAFDAFTRMGINTPTGAMPADWSGYQTGEFAAWGVGGEFRKGAAGQQVACYTPNSSCTMHDYCTINATDAELVNRTDLRRQAQAAFPCQTNASSAACHSSLTQDPLKVVMSAMADEPGWGAPISIPVATSSVVRQRWQHYLQAQGLTPKDFGETTWQSVLPDTARGDAGAGNTSAAGNPLELPQRKHFYWSVRFAHWDSCRYMAEWTAALQLASGDPSLQTYVNWVKPTTRLADIS